jgi:chromosome segregation ATPase
MDKNAFVERLHARLDEWSAEVDKLKAKANKAEAEAQIEYQKQIAALEEKRADMERKAAKLRGAGEDAWEEIKAGVENAWDAMEEAFTSARSKFK